MNIAKYIVILSALLIAAPAIAQESPPPPQEVPDAKAQVDAIMVPINALFAALASRDTSGIGQYIQDGATITIATGRSNEVRRISFDQWAAQIAASTDQYEEIMPDPAMGIDGNIAMVWGFYTFKRNGAFSHCGVNHFSLTREDGVWKIANLAFSVRVNQCREPS
ncbi:MAG: nuclear transport factor 2 family protein [Pseudomonadota bacterium]